MELYYKMKDLEGKGFSQRQISKKLGVGRNTVSSDFGMSSKQFIEYIHTLETRPKKLDPYREHILGWLREHPDLTGAQVHDWLIERMELKDVTQATVRSYVKDIRERYGIPKVKNQRVYAAVPEFRPGHQAQVDFGQLKVLTVDGKERKLYCIVFILSHSRFKYAEWLDRPFRTGDMIRAHENAFHYFGGMPEEMVYDQDAILAVSENAGDLILTSEFARYREHCSFIVHLCRRSDPESKGRVEQAVKYVKNNFAKNRLFEDLAAWNESTLRWLARTGNHNVHHNTKKRPAEVHALEKPHLRKIPSEFPLGTLTDTSITRTIHKDNVIRFSGNRYSVPAGTYRSDGRNVAYVEEKAGTLLIRLKPEAPPIAIHRIPEEKGLVVSDENHRKRDVSRSTILAAKITEAFADKELIGWYLDELRKKYPRYLSAQFERMEDAIRAHLHYVDEALEKARLLNLISANDFRDIASSLARDSKEKKNGKTEAWVSAYEHLRAAERTVDYYASVLGGNGHDQSGN